MHIGHLQCPSARRDVSRSARAAAGRARSEAQYRADPRARRHGDRVPRPQILKHNRSVALKVLHPELAATLGPERFRREITLAAKLQHPHILGVLRLRRNAQRPAVVHDAVRRRRELSAIGSGESASCRFEDALRIARDIGGALDYAHRARVRSPRHQAGKHSLLRRPRAPRGFRRRAVHGSSDGTGDERRTAVRR